jgi:hypothetical protein
MLEFGHEVGFIPEKGRGGSRSQVRGELDAKYNTGRRNFHTKTEEKKQIMRGGAGTGPPGGSRPYS